MQRDAAHLSELTHLIYSAALHPERWNNVVAAIAASLGSTHALLFTPYLSPHHGGFVFATGFDEAALQLWASVYVKHDIRAAQLRKKGLLLAGCAVVDEDLVPHQEFLSSRIYREFIGVLGLGRVCIGVVFAGTPDLPAVVFPVHRGPDDPFNCDDVAWMKLLVAHVSRAMGLMLRLDTARVQSAALLTSFDRLNFGVALLNDSMQVLHLNSAANSVLARVDGLRLNANRQFEGRITNTESHLPSVSSWLELLRHTPLAEQAHLLRGALVVRDDGAEEAIAGAKDTLSPKYYDLQCVCLPKTKAWFAQQQDACYVVFITDPKVVQLPNSERLTRLYGLTATQAKVTCELARGASYKEAARRLNISLDTVRSHVKAIYRKTRVNRQSDLMQLILSISQSGV